MTREQKQATQQIIAELQAHGSAEKAEHHAYFFKTGEGQYGEGDLFFGVTVPQMRAIAKKYANIGWAEIEGLLASPVHEVRLLALTITVEKYKKTKQATDKQKIVDFYLAHTQHINNWDLVDLSCYKILGDWLEDKDRNILYQLADSENLWEQRIAIVTCMHFIHKGDFDDCLAISDRLLHHKHDLIHKAVGWMLREVGKKDIFVLTDFLRRHYKVMPRTMLRYAIEKFPEVERQKYLKGTK
ncbi:DNA alkylation repair protein [Bacteroidia bacterium]|nr:DNA alkylation repair protein [Bacteroidia bacterium]